ncbi:MAG: ClpXP protease specificity-enhancing factor [Ideonella sp.]|nr:ClpXP protease specificity-enhancing factor [Ideonella sp.]
MTVPTAPSTAGTSTRPYLIRALHEWCTENGFTPYIAVQVDAGVRVPAEYVKNGEIVLNVGFEATSALKLGNEFIEFKARFGGSSRDISVPVTHVIAIYARENGQGMAFPAPTADSALEPGPQPRQAGTGGAHLALAEGTAKPDAAAEPPEPPPEPPAPGRPALKRVK